eukprot:6492655-Amphidinium_carterae.1
MATAKAQAKAKTKSKDSPSAEALHKVFDLGLAGHVQIPVEKGIHDIADKTKPFVLRATKCVLGMQMNNPTRVTMVILQAGFARSNVLVERRIFENTDGVRSDMLNTIKSDAQPCLAESLRGMKDNMVVAAKRGYEFIGFESKGLGCVKAVITDGSELFVAAVPLSDLAKYMENKGSIKSKSPVSPVQWPSISVSRGLELCNVFSCVICVCSEDFFQDMTQAQADDLSHHCPLHMCTVKSADLLYIPAGWLLLEQVRSTVSGCVWRPSSESLTGVKKMIEMAHSSGASSEKNAEQLKFLQDAVNALSVPLKELSTLIQKSDLLDVACDHYQISA